MSCCYGRGSEGRLRHMDEGPPWNMKYENKPESWWRMKEAQGIILFQEYTLPISSYAQQALLALMSSSNKLEMTFNF